MKSFIPNRDSINKNEPDAKISSGKDFDLSNGSNQKDIEAKLEVKSFEKTAIESKNTANGKQTIAVDNRPALKKSKRTVNKLRGKMKGSDDRKQASDKLSGKTKMSKFLDKIGSLRCANVSQKEPMPNPDTMRHECRQIVYPRVVLTEEPAFVTCPACNCQIQTVVVDKGPSALGWFLCVATCLCCLCVCCLAPAILFITDLRVFYHSCPKCNAYIGKTKGNFR